MNDHYLSIFGYNSVKNRLASISIIERASCSGLGLIEISITLSVLRFFDTSREPYHNDSLLYAHKPNLVPVSVPRVFLRSQCPA